ncbi:MAG: MerR family transcriptional regulator [Sulfuricella sp.]|nr:MerR family transcriptional regulator [Sulfuricella sp.]
MEQATKSELPPIPAKRYFTIGEVSELCDVKPHVLRYWEQEFTQLKPVKRRGNRRYYQHHEVLLIRRIRELLYEDRYTIDGARHVLEGGEAPKQEVPQVAASVVSPAAAAAYQEVPPLPLSNRINMALVRNEIKSIIASLQG